VIGVGINAEVLVALCNAAVFALWAILPALCIGYARQAIAARRMRPDVSLRRLESVELDRTILLYRKTSDRIKEIEALGNAVTGSFPSRYRIRAQIRHTYREELHDLTAYGHHLRATITRIRSRPIQRLMAKLHVISFRFAFSAALALYVALLAFLITKLYVADYALPVQELANSIDTLLLWTPIDERLIYANGIAAGLAAAVTPVFYLFRRMTLHIKDRSQIRSLTQFASADPDTLIHASQETHPDTHDFEEPVSVEFAKDESWFSVLELSPSATVDDVKEAYKTKIKQYHPDRVHGMAPVFRDLAERETKKINSAYEEALTSLQAAAY
jgi:DnaJ domain